MKNLPLITTLIGLSLLSCKETPNVIPQTTTQSFMPLTAVYTKKLDKQWLLGGSYMYIISKNKSGGQPYDTTYKVLKDTMCEVTVISDSVISFLGMDYHYIDTPFYGWGHNIFPDTTERLLFNYDYPTLNIFSYIIYYYKLDSFQYYYKAGTFHNIVETRYHSK